MNKKSTEIKKVLMQIVNVAIITALVVPFFGATARVAEAQTTTSTTTIGSTSTNAQLQAQINTLLMLISSLQTRLAQMNSGGNMGTAFVFTSDMTIGSRNDQVTRLQQYLVSSGHLVMPAGVAYGYFGTLTQAALSRFQIAQGISPTAGYFGPITRTRINAILAAQTPTTPPTTGTTTPPTIGGITTPGVEGTMSVTQANAGINSTVYEGGTGVPILGMRIEARTSDISVQRVRLNLGSNSTLYNRILSRIYLSDSSTSNAIVSRDLNSSNVIREGDNYFLDLTGLNYIIPRNTSRDLIVRADIRNSIDSEDRTSQTISLANNGVRGVDGAGIDHYSPSNGSIVSRSFSVQESLSENSTLRISLNSSSPQAQNVVASSGSENNEIDRLNLLAFDLRAERDDVTVTDFTVNITKTGTGSANASTTLYLYEGSTEIDNAPINGNTAVFRNLDYMIPINTTRTLTVRADIRNSDINNAVFTASASSSGIIAENELGDRLNTNDINGSAIGYPIAVRNIGPEITLSSASITTNGSPQFGGTSNMSTSTLTATFNLRIRAVGEDIILGTTASTSPAFGASTFRIYRNGAPDDSIGSAATSTSFTIPSGSNTSGLTNSFRIPEGTEVSMPVTFQILGRRPNGSPLPTGIYSVGFEGFRWQGGGTINTTNFMSGLVEWRTSDVSFP